MEEKLMRILLLDVIKACTKVVASECKKMTTF